VTQGCRDQIPTDSSGVALYSEENKPARHPEYAVDIALEHRNDLYEPHS